MQQAKTRNPDIVLDCLAWGAPGWIGNGNYYSQDMCDYIVRFHQRRANQLRPDVSISPARTMRPR